MDAAVAGGALKLASVSAVGTVSRPGLVLASVSAPVQARELDTYIVFAEVSPVPPGALRLPVSTEPVFIIGSGSVSLTVCGVEFDEVVLEIDGVGRASAGNIRAYANSCTIVGLEIRPRDPGAYKCSKSELRVSDCVAVSGCREVPWPGLVLVDTEGSWYGARSTLSYAITGSGRAYAYLDYVCAKGRVCMVAYPGSCCDSHRARLVLKKAGEVVSYTEFTLNVCSFG